MLSLRSTPVPGTVTAEPNMRVSVCVTETMVPSLSTTEKWVVQPSSAPTAARLAVVAAISGARPGERSPRGIDFRSPLRRVVSRGQPLPIGIDEGRVADIGESVGEAAPARFGDQVQRGGGVEAGGAQIEPVEDVERLADRDAAGLVRQQNELGVAVRQDAAARPPSPGTRPDPLR